MDTTFTDGFLFSLSFLFLFFVCFFVIVVFYFSFFLSFSLSFFFFCYFFYLCFVSVLVVRAAGSAMAHVSLQLRAGTYATGGTRLL